MIDHEYLRRWAVVIAIASAVTAFGARYAVLEYKIIRLDNAVDDISKLKAYNEVYKEQLNKMEDKINSIHSRQSEVYLDE